MSRRSGIDWIALGDEVPELTLHQLRVIRNRLGQFGVSRTLEQTTATERAVDRYKRGAEAAQLLADLIETQCHEEYEADLGDDRSFNPEHRPFTFAEWAEGIITVAEEKRTGAQRAYLMRSTLTQLAEEWQYWSDTLTDLHLRQTKGRPRPRYDEHLLIRTIEACEEAGVALQWHRQSALTIIARAVLVAADHANGVPPRKHADLFVKLKRCIQHWDRCRTRSVKI